MPKIALSFIIAGCALPFWFYLGPFWWSQAVKMSSACLGMALAFTGLAMLVGRNE